MARALARLIASLFGPDRATLDVLGAALVAFGIAMIYVPAGVIAAGVALILIRLAQDSSP